MYCLPELVHLVGGKLAELACGQVAQLELAVAHALEVANLIPDGAHHAAVKSSNQVYKIFLFTTKKQIHLISP